MPKLYLLRHAEADSSFGIGDKDRPLTNHGITQAGNTAMHLKDIDVALCSAAKRTQMTLESAVASDATIKKTEILDVLYNAPAETLLENIQDVSNGNVLVIAHNPGIHQLAASMAQEGGAEQLNQLMMSYPPSSLSIFDCDIDSWQELKLHQNKLIDFIRQN